MDVDKGVPGHHVVELWCNIFRGCSLKVLGFLIESEIVRRIVGARCFKRGFFRSSGTLGADGHIGDGLGVVIWGCSVEVGVGFAMSG